MKKFLDKSRLKNGVRAVQINDIWEKIMGKTIAKHTDKIEIIQRTLFISTSIAPLKQELHYQREKIIERINESLRENAIDKIIIR